MTTPDTTIVMDQFGADTSVIETPLHHAELSAMATQTNVDDAGVHLNERGLTGQLVLRLRGDAVAASSAVESVLGVALPERLQFTGDPLSYEAVSVAWLSPDEWRISCPIGQAFEIEQKLRTALTAVNETSHAILNNSGGFSVLDLSGPNALDVLKKSTGYDVRPSRFPVGKVVGTTFAKTGVTLLRTGDASWQLWVRRSFADYVWLWLQQSTSEFGLKILED